MIKITTIIGTRPEFIKMSRIIAALDKNFDQTIIHTGQNFDYELNQIFFEDLKIRKPDYFLHSASNNAVETIGNIIIKTNKILDKIKPRLVFLLGDTNSCYAALASNKSKIPVFHYEAGNRCYDNSVPEEVNRKIIDHLSDVNITYSDIAKNNLTREGFPSDKIVSLGSPMYEVIVYYKNKINKSKILSILKVKKNKYFLISIHREENVDEEKKLRSFFKIFEELQKIYKIKIIISLHYRTAKKLKHIKLNITNKNIIILKPLNFTDYIKLQKESYVTLSDSGTLAEESSILKFPAIHLGHCTERPEAIEDGSMVICNNDLKKIIQTINFIKNKKNHVKEIYPKYKIKNISQLIVSTILSYIDYKKKF